MTKEELAKERTTVLDAVEEWAKKKTPKSTLNKQPNGNPYCHYSGEKMVCGALFDFITTLRK